jgi:hypothetical protein
MEANTRSHGATWSPRWTPNLRWKHLQVSSPFSSVNHQTGQCWREYKSSNSLDGNGKAKHLRFFFLFKKRQNVINRWNFLCQLKCLGIEHVSPFRAILAFCKFRNINKGCGIICYIAVDTHFTFKERKLR